MDTRGRWLLRLPALQDQERLLTVTGSGTGPGALDWPQCWPRPWAARMWY
jgi:hypothetical protein